MQMTKNYAMILTGSCVACFLLGMALGGFLFSDDDGDDVQKVQLVRPPRSEEQLVRSPEQIQQDVEAKATKVQIGNVHAAAELYAFDIGNYPITEQGLQALVEPPSAAIAEQWDGPYLSGDVPLDPWDNAYRYEYHPVDGEDTKPKITSAGPDGKFGTEDDIKAGL